ncbi:MAG TPA: hypothetical protein VNE58_11140 [Casimicrobiaceae bacterium]|nr:hypothetical protein [Casimicrobiaceae bacterium]
MLAATMTLIAVAGCQNEGPAERAGNNIDNAANKAGPQMEKAGDKIHDATKK